jgi:hypothetical protein
LPEILIFYNEGVKLTTIDSPVINSLKAMEKKGERIMLCGTCIDNYNLKEKIAIGIISNMASIIEAIFNADSIIYP